MAASVPVIGGVIGAAPREATGPRWERPAVAGLLVATALLYLWNLGASGWANAYYTAAVFAGTKSWEAFLYGSLDPSNFITVDKAPASLWVMEISARLFGFNSWTVLAPQALEGVATVALTYLAVRRWSGPAAGLLAGAVVALTPVAALMFRYNNPDALLVLLVTLATYLTLRAVEDGRTRWLVGAGVAVGFGFLAKELQALIVVPVLAGVYLLSGPAGLRRRLLQLLAAGVAVVVSAGWWVAIVLLTPASARPYIGGSQDNNLLSPVLGYNGFGRLTGQESGSVGGGPVPGSMWGPTGWNRLFTATFGGEISWLLPAALVLLVAMLILTARRPRTDMTRAAVLAWGGTLLLTGAVISFAQGIIHPYYTVALAPAIGGLTAMGLTSLWQRRAEARARLPLATALVATVCWGSVLLSRTPAWQPALGPLGLVVGLASALLFVAIPSHLRRLVGIVAGIGLASAVAAPAAFSLATAAVDHSGAIPSAGPAGAVFGGPGGGAFSFRRGGPAPAGFAPPPGAPSRGGGFLGATASGPVLVGLIRQGSAGHRWAVATIDANRAAGFELSSGVPVMAIGGFNGTDPAPTLSQFRQMVDRGDIHYFIGDAGGPGAGGAGPPAGGFRGGPPPWRPGTSPGPRVSPGGPLAGGASANAIAAWVAATFTSTVVDGTVIYDLTRPAT